MHKKKKYINKSMYSIQGLRTVGNSLPKTLGKILKKGGHNYSSIINNWADLVGIKPAQQCYPKAINTIKDLKDGVLVLNVSHGNELDVEYSKKNIIDKINSFFGYNFIKQVKTVVLDNEIDYKKTISHLSLKNKKLSSKINQIKNLSLKKKLNNLVKEYENKNSK